MSSNDDASQTNTPPSPSVKQGRDLSHAWRALRHRNFRLFFGGQSISLIGTWMTRIAPMLGLMGTLIPLGPALTGLASGDLATLSSNLVVAFTATVVGVLLGCCSYTMNLVRKNWYQRDHSTLEHLFTHANRPALP